MLVMEQTNLSVTLSASQINVSGNSFRITSDCIDNVVEAFPAPAETAPSKFAPLNAKATGKYSRCDSLVIESQN